MRIFCTQKTVGLTKRQIATMFAYRISRRPESGFTLLELLIAVAIIGILSAIAYPSYMETIYKGRRSDGQQALMNAVNRQEQFFLDHNAYGSAAAAGIPATSSEGYYNIVVTSVNVAACGGSPCYLITASATGAQASDSACTTLTIHSNGTKGKTGSGTVADCW